MRCSSPPLVPRRLQPAPSSIPDLPSCRLRHRSSTSEPATSATFLGKARLAAPAQAETPPPGSCIRVHGTGLRTSPRSPLPTALKRCRDGSSEPSRPPVQATHLAQPEHDRQPCSNQGCQKFLQCRLNQHPIVFLGSFLYPRKQLLDRNRECTVTAVKSFLHDPIAHRIP